MPEATVAEGPAAEATIPRIYRVCRKEWETSDTVTLEIGRAEGDGPGIDSPEPGQFLMLYAFGVGEAPISTSGVPGANELRHSVRRVGPVTAALCDLEVGDALGVRGPYGRAWPVEAAEGRDVVVVAGGIGLAPLRPLIEHVIARRDRFGSVTVLVGARTPHDLLYRDELEVWGASDDIEVLCTVDTAGRAWLADVGVVTALLGRVTIDPSRVSAFVCGPEVMMRLVARELMGRDVAPTRIWVSLERNMQCAVRHCGHCQIGPVFVCADGPVFDYATASELLAVRSR